MPGGWLSIRSKVYTLCFLRGFVSGNNLGAVEPSWGHELFSMAVRGRSFADMDANACLSHYPTLTQALVTVSLTSAIPQMRYIITGVLLINLERRHCY